jgi:hypothetical protein
MTVSKISHTNINIFNNSKDVFSFSLIFVVIELLAISGFFLQLQHANCKTCLRNMLPLESLGVTVNHPLSCIFIGKACWQKCQQY